MIKINLLPKDARKHVGLTQQIVIMAIMILATIFGIAFAWSTLDGMIAQRQEEIARTQQRLQELQKVIEEINKFEAQRQALEQKLAVIAKLEKEQKIPVHMLDELFLTLEDDMWLMSFQQQNQNISVNGSALSNPVVSDYMRNLEESPYFSNIELVVSQSRQIGSQTVRDFQLKVTLTPPQEAAAAPEQSEETAAAPQ
mgnify:FL=1